ncbi:hypothetical protein MOSE0_N13036 [Monosporozyma servazzii]
MCKINQARMSGRIEGSERSEDDRVEVEEVAAAIANDGRGRFLHGLLYLDYVLMLITLPMAIYSLMNVFTNVITFDPSSSEEEDIMMKVVRYLRTGAFTGGTMDKFGLLGKIHTTIVYYTAPLQFIRYYSVVVKVVATTIYLAYGLVGSSYIIFLNIFFMMCLILTVFRKYQDLVASVVRRFV